MIVRGDVPTGVQAAMIVHAAGESAQLPEARATGPPTRAVALAATEAELRWLAAELAAAGVAHVLVREPDAPWNGAVMALGLAPAPRRLARRLLAHLPLVRGEEPCP